MKAATLACSGCRFCGPLRTELSEVRAEFHTAVLARLTSARTATAEE